MERQKKYDEDIINYIIKGEKVYLMLFNTTKGILINKNEFVKAVASLAFNDGNCEINIDKDAFGDYVFKNEQEEMIAAMKVQFFYENTTSADKVRNLVSKYKQKQ